MYASDTTEPMDTPSTAPAEPTGRPSPAFIAAYAMISPEMTLNSTSSTSSTVVGIMLPLPWQYPRYADTMHTRSIAGLIAFMLSAASGFSRYTAASQSGKRNMTSANARPITKNVARATRNVFSSCFARPFASASATRRDSATGRPAVASVKKMK